MAQLGVDGKGKVGASGLVGWVCSSFRIEEAAFFVEGFGSGSVVAGGEGACKWGEDVIPSGRVASGG